VLLGAAASWDEVPNRAAWSDRVVGPCKAGADDMMDLPTCANFCLCATQLAIAQSMNGLLQMAGVDFEVLKDAQVQRAMQKGERVSWITLADFEEPPPPPPSVGELAAGVNTSSLLAGLSSDEDDAPPPATPPAGLPPVPIVEAIPPPGAAAASIRAVSAGTTPTRNTVPPPL
jgi:hypothetical protein